MREKRLAASHRRTPNDEETRSCASGVSVLKFQTFGSKVGTGTGTAASSHVDNLNDDRSATVSTSRRSWESVSLASELKRSSMSSSLIASGCHCARGLRLALTSKPMKMPPTRDGRIDNRPGYHILALEVSEDEAHLHDCMYRPVRTEHAQSELMHVYVAPRSRRVQRVRFIGEMHDLSRLVPMAYEWTIDPSISRDPLRFEVPVDYGRGCRYSLIVDDEVMARDTAVPL